jgi:RNA polymerase sigma-70 factor (ECF subfamily)
MASVTNADVTGEPTDRELVAGCQRGESDAFDELVRRHQGRALNVAFQVVRNREDAIEVAQDAFVKVYQHIGEFRGECEFTTWLHQIVINLARNRYRWWSRRGADKTVSFDQPLDSDDGPMTREPAGLSVAPDDVAGHREFALAIARHMERLPARHREVLVLRNVEDLSYEEIAVALRCSVGTVKSRIARAREALREAMAGEL